MRLGFYSGDNEYEKPWGEVNVAGCWEKAKREMNAWLSKGRLHVEYGLSGTISDLKGAEAWADSPRDCLGI